MVWNLLHIPTTHACDPLNNSSSVHFGHLNQKRTQSIVFGTILGHGY